MWERRSQFGKVKLSLYLIKPHNLKYGGAEVLLHVFLSLAVKVSKWSAPCTGRTINRLEGGGQTWFAYVENVTCPLF
jgi:hypothetical protein